MKTQTIVALLTAVLVLIPAASARTETQSFVAGNGALTVYTSTTAGAPFDVGGNRFYLDGSESSVTVTVSEASNNGINFYNGGGTVVARGKFCTSGTFDIPLDATRFTVFVGSDVSGVALNSFACGVFVAPAAGTITADFA